jgi:hypothetical protein
MALHFHVLVRGDGIDDCGKLPQNELSQLQGVTQFETGFGPREKSN